MQHTFCLTKLDYLGMTVDIKYVFSVQFKILKLLVNLNLYLIRKLCKGCLVLTLNTQLLLLGLIIF